MHERDYAAWQRSKAHRIRALRLNITEVWDGVRSILIILAELATWKRAP